MNWQIDCLAVDCVLVIQFEAKAAKQLALSDWVLSSGGTGARVDRVRDAGPSSGSSCNSPLARSTNASTSTGQNACGRARAVETAAAVPPAPPPLDRIELVDRPTGGATGRLALRRADAATEDLTLWWDALAAAIATSDIDIASTAATNAPQQNQQPTTDPKTALLLLVWLHTVRVQSCY